MKMTMTGLMANFESHTEHVHGSITNYVLNQGKALPGDQFKALDLELPAELPFTTRGLIGPSVGDAPVPEEGAGVYYAVRPGSVDRQWLSRLVDRQPEPTRFVRAICVPVTYKVVDGMVTTDEAKEDWAGDTCTCLVLATVYGIACLGEEQAPQEPMDPNCKDVEASKAFWAVHALCAPRD